VGSSGDIRPVSQPSSLYLHIPFCERKCVYCDFYSIEGRSAQGDFLHALEREVLLRAPEWADHEFATVFFGGGTPSLLSPEEFERINGALRRAFRILPGAEWTAEANPGTVSMESLEGYRRSGINRLSFGIQSFDEGELRFLGRIHDARQAEDAVTLARASGFDNVSVDLIYSLPGQSREGWRRTLDRAVGLGPDHISAYSLIVEHNTPLSRLVNSGRVVPNSSESEAALYEETMQTLDAAGYEHYEVSNYARPGFRSRHNSAYWQHVPYLGLGPSAHSFCPDRDWKGAKRRSNIANVSAYLARLGEGVLPESGGEDLGRKDLINERIFLGLRSDGIDTGRFEADFGVPFPASSMETLEELSRLGKVIRDGPRHRLTAEGYLICDEIAARIFV
jgi:oxygen-independent coproporphyrinogen III oxidase